MVRSIALAMTIRRRITNYKHWNDVWWIDYSCLW